MTDYQKMYLTMFNAVTDALEHMERLDFGMAKKTLLQAQCIAEEIYMEQNTDFQEQVFEQEKAE